MFRVRHHLRSREDTLQVALCSCAKAKRGRQSQRKPSTGSSFSIHFSTFMGRYFCGDSTASAQWCGIRAEITPGNADHHLLAWMRCHIVMRMGEGLHSAPAFPYPQDMCAFASVTTKVISLRRISDYHHGKRYTTGGFST